MPPTCLPEPPKSRLIRPRCGNSIHGVGECGDGDIQCESCKKENFVMSDETIRKHKFHPESFPLAPSGSKS